MYHIFICSTVDGNLGCFHVLAMVTSDTTNIEIQETFHLWAHPKKKIDLRINLFIIFFLE